MLWQPRISLILAFDNFGNSYVALSQSNTNSDVILLFMRDLVRQLNEQDRRWRQKTLIFWDGAKYHQSKTTMKMLRELDVPMMITGPHSYDAGPCELWFAMFKKVDINPRKIKTGKR
jgi:transposase